MAELSKGGVRWLVDGMNVIGARPNRWWKDRPRAMRELVVELAAYTRATGEAVGVVFDGRPVELPQEREQLMEVAFAGHGRANAADDEIARHVAGDHDPSTLRIVTSDRELAARGRERGVEVVGAGSFRRRLERAVE